MTIVYPGHGDKMLREQVLSLLGTFGEPEVKAEAFARFNAHVIGEKLLAGDIKAPVSLSLKFEVNNFLK